MTDILSKYDAFEIQPCLEISQGVIEVCEASEAHFWTIYGHIDGQGVEALADCPTKEIAETIMECLDAKYITKTERF